MSVRTTQIVAVLAMLLGAAGIAIGVVAKQGNKSDEDIAESVKAELTGEVGTTKKQLIKSQARTNSRLDALEGQIAKLEKQLKAVSQNLSSFSDQLANDVTRLDARITELSKRVDKVQNAETGP